MLAHTHAMNQTRSHLTSDYSDRLLGESNLLSFRKKRRSVSASFGDIGRRLPTDQPEDDHDKAESADHS
jgi:hypothetical protein